MISGASIRRTFLGREVAVAFALLVALYLVRVIRFQPVQIPAYLLIVAYDIVEAVVPAVAPYHDVGFPLFLYLLSVLGGAAGRRLADVDRDGDGGRSGEEGRDGHGSAASRAVGGICLLLGVLTVLFGGIVGGSLAARGRSPVPLLATFGVGVAFLAASWVAFEWPRRRESPPADRDG